MQSEQATQPATETSAEGVAKRPELYSGEKLLVSAYLVVWAVTFIFIVMAWRRTRGLEEKLVMIEGGLKKARAEHEKRLADEAAARPARSSGDD